MISTSFLNSFSKLFILFVFSLFCVTSNAAPSIERITVAPGCEDMELDGNRIIIACDDRTKNNSGAGIYTFSPDTKLLKPMSIQKDKVLSFHPHGIFLLKDSQEKLLYVINHSKKQENAENENYTEVLVFIVDNNGLRLKEVLSDSNDLFDEPNDLYVTKKGTVFMTNPSSYRKSLLRFSPSERNWSIAVSGYSYPNGVHVKDSYLYLNNSFNGKQYRFKVKEDSSLGEENLILDSLGAADNFTESSEGFLYFCGAKSIWGFLRHLLKKSYIPNALVFKFDTRKGKVQKLVAPDINKTIAAPSVVLEFKNKLYFGQPFNNDIFVITDPVWKNK